jgi:ankyrin repeat protein
MPQSSGTTSFAVQSLPDNASLENLRKQAKSLLKAVRDNEANAVARFNAFHPRPNRLQSATLSDAQLVIARNYGFPSWAKLKLHFDVVAEYTSLPDALTAADKSSSLVDRFISLACLNYTNDHISRREEADKFLAAHPELSRENIYAAATVGDVEGARQMLAGNPSLAKTRGGPRNWEPLLYAAYSRVNSQNHSTLEVARILLEHGADPNAGFLWDRHYLFTALTGVFGEGERGRTNQPPHPESITFARLLLEHGADPNDGQTLYNRMFTGGTRHLELLFEFGLGNDIDSVWRQRLGAPHGQPAEMLRQQLAWAVKYNQLERLQLLIEHGVDLNQPDTRFHRLPYELALMNGNLKTAEFLLQHGAHKTELSTLEKFKAACLNADEGEARSLLAKDPTLLTQLGRERAELLNRAAESDRRDAIRLMVALGFDLNERKRTAPIHLAAAGGHLEMLKLLIELGADPSLRDEEYDGTALGWAEFSGRTAVIEWWKSMQF